MKFYWVKTTDWNWCAGADFFSFQLWKLVFFIKIPYRWRIPMEWIFIGFVVFGWVCSGIGKVLWQIMCCQDGASGWKGLFLEILKGPL